MLFRKFEQKNGFTNWTVNLKPARDRETAVAKGKTNAGIFTHSRHLCNHGLYLSSWESFELMQIGTELMSFATYERQYSYVNIKRYNVMQIVRGREKYADDAARETKLTSVTLCRIASRCNRL